MSDRPKKPSGAHFKKLRREREEQERREEQGRKAEALGGAAPYAALGEPPLGPDRALGAIEYAQQHALVAIHEVATDPALPARERWKLIAELCRSIGMTHSRAVLHRRVAHVVEALGEKREAAAGVTTLADAGIEWPTTPEGAE